MDEDFGGGLIAFILGIAVVIFVVYIVIMIASVIAAIASGAGIVWGGGTALVNYGKSFKENMIDSNTTSGAAA